MNIRLIVLYLQALYISNKILSKINNIVDFCNKMSYNDNKYDLYLSVVML